MVRRRALIQSFCAVVAACSIGCGTSAPRWWETTAPSPTTTPVPGSSIPTRQVHLFVEPTGLTGGGSATGTLTLNVPAPDSGLLASLSSSNAAAEVPTSIAFPPGVARVTFPVTTRAVPDDVRADIVGSIPGSSTQASVDVWAILPTSLSYASEPGDTVGLGRTERFTPANSTFVARCENGGNVWVQISTPSRGTSLLLIGARTGSPLRPGTYEGATRFGSATNPKLDVAITGSGCNSTTGRFVVSEADFSTTGDVRRLILTFEQHCNGQGPALRGELRLTGPFPLPPFALSCQR